MGSKKIPEVRFKEFSGEWEEWKLGEVADVYDGTHQTPKYTKEGIMFLSVENIKSLKSSKYISEEAFNKEFRIRPEKNDLLMTRIGDIGTANVVDEDVPIAYYVSLALIKTQVLNPYFLQANIHAPTTQKELWRKTLHIAFPKKINKNEISKITILCTSFEEQMKIGCFFKKLNEIIALKERELDTLKQTKQGFLQKMFPKEGELVPEIRFTGFSGEWRESRLISLVDRVKSYSLSRDVETLNDTGFRYIHYGDIHKKIANIVGRKNELPNILAGDYELLKKGDLVLADASEDYQGIATPALVYEDIPYKLVAGLHTIALRPKQKQVNSLFLYYLINSHPFRKHGYRVGTGMKVFGISLTNVLKFEYVYPSIDEQTKIGEFFMKIDETITLKEKELDILKQTKKAFLQKMFV
ncbi:MULTISPECIES: restriction endonuclease subunit S [Bacillus]|uniref:restriction endonuclease subunit S n=1 Tax=Bacillus TaxID=1386 RepID=UPI0030F747AE|nr:restriction endonuclease subunit S [Bacillus altitudinis]